MFDFTRIKLVARREVTTRFKMKAYRITLIVQVIVAILAGLSPIAISYFTGDSLGGQVIVVDETNSSLATSLQGRLTDDIPGLPPLEVVEYTEGADSARSAVKDGDAALAVILTNENGAPNYEIVTSNSGVFDITAQRVQAAIVAGNVEVEAIQLGVPQDQAAGLVAAPAITVEGPQGETQNPADNFSGPMFAVVNIGLVLIYMSLIMYGTWIAQGVVEEKSSRMMEIMVNAATPRDLLVGKILGVLIAGLCQTVPMLLAGGLAFSLQPRIADALGVQLTSTFDLDFAAISFQAIWVFLVYFVLGYMLYGSLFAATGSLVSRQEEVNQAIAPIMILVIVGLMLAYVVMALPDSLFSRVLFQIPFTSPFVAMARILMGNPGTSEILMSIAILAVTGLLAMLLAGRVYRTGVLMYGQKPSLLSIFRLNRAQTVAR